MRVQREAMKTWARMIALLALCIAVLSCGNPWQSANQRRRAYLEGNYLWNEQQKNAILSGRLFLGMTESAVIASWDEPERKNRTIGSWGVHEQWVYGYRRIYLRGPSSFVPRQYLYFENGKLTSMQSFD